MSSVVIRVQDVSKQYRLGNIGTGTVSHDLNRWWHRVLGKQDPYLKIGEVNDRTIKGTTNYVWALQNINFEVNHGEVLGIIGRNGAGKSTLLKILSRTTMPTLGRVRIKGRVASLLEVGTGFHPELTGRENVYLNGAIMGMTKREIKEKFDEIVDFAGVERYIDTPVKRYSSGMYVRLAFGVAAHLEPEILVVDEVLAVGDAEFQKKCLGKMKDVSVNEGRTVLFVSHNLDAVKALCDKGLLLHAGTIHTHGSIGETIHKYLESEEQVFEKDFLPSKKSAAFISRVSLNRELLKCGQLEMNIQFQSSYPIQGLVTGFILYNSLNFPIFGSNTRFHKAGWSPDLQISEGNVRLFIDDLALHSGTYKISFWLADRQADLDDQKEALLFEYTNPNHYINIPDPLFMGVVDKKCQWDLL